MKLHKLLNFNSEFAVIPQKLLRNNMTAILAHNSIAITTRTQEELEMNEKSILLCTLRSSSAQ